jgi:hypothetical protein
MQQTARAENQEYWRPVDLRAARVLQVPVASKACPFCKAEYLPSSHFCHVCGNQRDPHPAARQFLTFADYFDLGIIRRWLGLSLACMTCLVVGFVCLFGAAITGVLYRAQTVAEWQAVQTWRMEWLMAAVAVLLAGILLKNNSA